MNAKQTVTSGTSSEPRSLLSHLVTKKYATRRAAEAARDELAGLTKGPWRASKTGERVWTLRGYVRDTEYEGEHSAKIRELLQRGGSYGTQTYTTEG